MATIEFWEGDASGQTPWNTLNLGGKIWPGIWEIDCPVERKIDVKKAKGKDKADIKDEGYEVTKLVLTGRLANKTQFDQFQVLLAEIHPRKAGGVRTPTEILHPKANLLGISTIYVNKIDVNTPTAKSGMTVKMDAFEIAKPEAVTAKSGAAGSMDAEIAKLNKAIADLDVLIKDSLTPGKPNFGDVQFHAAKTAQRKQFVAKRDELLAKKKGTKGSQPKPSKKPDAPSTENLF
jgi:hypothetical protein